MKDILLQHGGNYIAAEISDLDVTLTYSDLPKSHDVHRLRNRSSYEELKAELDDIYEESGCTRDSYEDALMYLQTVACHDKYFVRDLSYGYNDLRSRDEISEYLKEADDKVWLMRNCSIADKEPVHEVSRKGVMRIFETYRDIPKDGYTDWECGYWNGIMGALRWVLGDEKDFLDT